MYLTRNQIAQLVGKIGQPKASVLLNRFFLSYCHSLDSSDVLELYDDEYGKKISAHEVYRLVEGRYKVNVYNRYTYEYLGKAASPGMRLLDFGCGDGSFSMALAAEHELDVVGIEIEDEVVRSAAAVAQRGNLSCRFRSGGIHAVREHECFDFISLNDVVEHLSDRELRNLFVKIKEVLSPGGEIVIHTPNGLALCNDTDWSVIQMLYKVYLRLCKGWSGFERSVDQIYYDQVHINIKSYHQLAKVLGDAGFQSRVIYDNPHKYGVMDSLSPNMLVVARHAAR